MSIVHLALLGSVNGYITARCLKFFNQADWKESASISCGILPFWVCAGFTSLDVLEWWQGSSTAIPFSRALIYIIFWLVLTIPLSIWGAYNGFMAPKKKAAYRISPVRRRIPENQPWYLNFFF